MIVKLLTEHHLEFLNLKGGCRGSSETTHVKMPYCWKSHALAHIVFFLFEGHFCLSKQCRPDEMLHYAAFYLGLHCLPKYSLRSQSTRVKELKY